MKSFTLVSRHKISQHIPAILLFSLFLVIGWLFHRDYGLHWDSWGQYELGLMNFNYIFDKDTSLLNYAYRYYGPFFEILLTLLSRSQDIPEMFFTQHLLTFFYFWCGLIAFYVILYRMTASTKAAIAGSLMLFLSPRILADSFYNTKDIPFMSAFIISFLTLHLTYTRLHRSTIGLHAIASAIMMAIRLQGIFIYPLSFLVFSALFFQSKDPRYRMRIIIYAALYSLLSLGFLILIFPALWHNPFSEILHGLQQLSRFPWPGGAVLYRGVMVDATQLPWHYAPVWIFITTPILISVLFVIGLIFLFLNFIRKPDVFIRDYFWYCIALLWLTLPLVSIWLFQSVLYDGWRHLFFIYPAYLIIAVAGYVNLEKSFITNKSSKFHSCLFSGIILTGMLPPFLFIVQNHPHEYVYFNEFAGADYGEIKRKYEMDYWGLAYFDSLKWLTAISDQPEIRVKFDNTPGRLNAIMLPPDDSKRIIAVPDISQADFFITNYRWHPKPFDLEEFKTIQVNGTSINSIYRVNSHPTAFE